MRDLISSIFFSLILPLTFWLALTPLEMLGQENEMKCGSDQMHRHLLDYDAGYQRKYLQFQRLYQQKVRDFQGDDHLRNATIYTIPLVVHIIHAGAPLGSDANPNDETIANIVAEASQRFRHTHSGAGSYSNPYYGMDTEIELCLANTDPNGNYTSGVTRHYDPDHAVGAYGDIAPTLNNHAWDKSKYCNLYIVTDLTNASGVYMGGYDFTIYDSPAFWSGLIAHELGHYFNLRHTFQGACPNNNCLTDGDEVCDTPPKASSGFNGGSCASPTNGCSTDDDDTSPNNPYRPVASGGLGDQPDMFANYMDYTGSCWDSFTAGQKLRMRTDIETYRMTLANNSTACNGTSPSLDAGVIDLVLNQSDVCQSSFTPQVTFKNYGTNTLTSLQIVVDVDGVPNSTTHWTGSLAGGQQTALTLSSPVLLSAGDHILRFHTQFPNGGADLNIYNDSEYRSVQYLGGTTCESFESCANFNPTTASGPGNNTVVNTTGPFPSSSHDVQICVSTQGDVSWSQEVFDVYDEHNVWRGRTNYLVDCDEPTIAFCFTASLNDYNAWKSNGTITVTLSPISSEINPNLCTQFNRACVSINVPQGNCDPSMVLNGTISTGTYQADSYIQADGVILNGSNVNLGANQYIELMQDFELLQGAIFTIHLIGCQ